MASMAEALRELHRLHQQLSDLRDRIERGPRQIKARQTTLTQVEDRVTHAHADVKTARIAVDQKHLQLKSGEAKIDDLKGKLNAANNNREYQALKEQIAASEMANSVLADEILEAMEKVDQLKASAAEAETHLARGKEELAKVQQTVKSQQESLLGDLSRVEGNLKEAESRLPADMADLYRRAVKGRGAEAMAPVEGESCGGCYQQLTTNMMSDLMMDRVVVACKSCGRLLYLPEDRAPAKR
jgi:uncharacterized protein